MTCLPDTNILLRSLQPHHPHHTAAVGAVETLLFRGETMYLLPQIIREFWNVCTRPIENNGLGFSPAETLREVFRLEAIFPLLPDHPGQHMEWRRLVTTHSVLGVQVHDAHLVAGMIVYGVSHLLTFNPTHFQRYPEITVWSPQDVVLP